MKMNVGQSVEYVAEESEMPRESLLLCRLVHHRPHMS
jgi:hypothetical protein